MPLCAPWFVTLFHMNSNRPCQTNLPSYQTLLWTSNWKHTVICWKANYPNRSTSFVVPLAVAVKSLPKTKRIIRLIHFNIPRNETCVLAKAVRF